jgi:hypothetical protein
MLLWYVLQCKARLAGNVLMYVALLLWLCYATAVCALISFLLLDLIEITTSSALGTVT